MFNDHSLVLKATYALVLALSLLALPRAVHAQRGADFVRQDEPTATPMSGFPGFFDAYMADEGSLVTEIPTLSVDYGVTPDLTLGASFGGPVFSGNPGGGLKLRYRLFSGRGFASALTGYGGLMRDAGREVRSAWAIATSNTSFYFSNRSVLTLSAMGGVYYETLPSSAGEEGSKHLTMVVLGAGYQFFFTSWFGIQAFAGAFVNRGQSFESESVSAKLDLASGDFETQLVGRVLLDFRPGTWLLSVGVGSAYGLGFPIAPWLSVAKAW